MCRSFLGYYENPITKTEENDGRNNNGVISVNLVKIALEASGYNNDKLVSDYKVRKERFYKKLDEVLDVCKEGLLYRIHRLENEKASIAPILYGNSELGCYGATGQSLHPNDEIGKIFGKRTSISLGYVGLHETILALFDRKIFNDEEMINEAKEIMKYLYNTAKKWSSETAYSFSIYGTPRFLWGIIK